MIYKQAKKEGLERLFKAGVPDAVHWICAMDKEYMKGFCGIRYERSQAVSEGAPYCDYRLSRKETQ